MPNSRRIGDSRPWPHCGCFVIVESRKKYLPQLDIQAHTTILSTTTRTRLTQTFTNPLPSTALNEVRYTFPLYDSVSVVGFSCTIGSRTIRGVVKERQKAKQDFSAAKSEGKAVGLLEQSTEATDIFTTTLGNVPAGGKIIVEITYLGELRHDAEVDGLRFTIPTGIAPRYAEADQISASHAGSTLMAKGGISITVDAEMPAGTAIKSVQSPSHPISVGIGTLSTDPSAEPSLQKASATLALGSAELDRDFVIQVVATNLGNPSAVFESHPTIPNQRAIMATLVPKFNMPAEKPEVVFVCDRSGSMGISNKIPNLVAALQIFLKSLPVGVKFNVCSFGNDFEFLWPRSQTYSQETLDNAVKYIARFDAGFGGTRMFGPVKETFEKRWKDMNLEVFLMTDGEISDQEKLFNLINDNVAESNGAIRVFTLGVGSDVSHALIEGAARAGNGFAQTVAEYEKMDKKVVRMLKAALTPHIRDYTLEVKYGKVGSDGSDDDFVVVEKIMDALNLDTQAPAGDRPAEPKKPISLFDPNVQDDDAMDTDVPASVDTKFDHLPQVTVPRYLQAPFQIPALFPFNRTSVYVLLSDSTPDLNPHSVILRGTSAYGPLELEIPITPLGEKGTTIHQLAARKAVQDLEEWRGWLKFAKGRDGKLLKEQFEGHFFDMVEREAVRLGVEYQVGGKWCSFVAVQESEVADGKPAEEVGQFEVIHGDTIGNRLILTSQLANLSQARSAMPVYNAATTSVRRRVAAAPASSGISMGGSSRPKSSRRRSVQRSDVELQPAVAMPLPSEDEAEEESEEDARKAKVRIYGDVSYDRREDAAHKVRKFKGKLSKDGSEDHREDALQKITSLQTFVGSWTWSSALEGLLKVTKETVMRLNLPAKGSHSLDVMATVCTIAFLKKRLSDDKEAWEMMVEKAEAWLKLETGGDAEALKNGVEALV